MGKKASEYWREVCAPAIRRRKKDLGRGVPEREIAAYVEAESGKLTSRGLVSLFVSGKREPYISQFIALCSKLDLDPVEILSGRVVVKTTGALAHIPERQFVKGGNNASIPQGKTAMRPLTKSHLRKRGQ